MREGSSELAKINVDGWQKLEVDRKSCPLRAIERLEIMIQTYVWSAWDACVRRSGS